jgi:4-amino-4-deoxy-L-arabinose transferase-like glycosyltransferase
MSTQEPAATLHGRDFALLIYFSLVLFSFPLIYDRTLSTHETVHCVNIREMRLDGDWIIPHFGGRPWLERPPLPFWLTLPVVGAIGDTPLAYRLAPLLVALPCILLAGSIASIWFGRGVGLLAGLILATIREFTHYAIAPECDMFLCGVVTTAMALFVYLEFRLRPAPGESGLFWGSRPWALLAFFLVLGLANIVKGLFFGDLLIVVPIAAYLLLGGERRRLIRRYLWLPGWVAFALAGSAWAMAAYLRHPDIVELWKSDYVGRLNEGYMGEPAWYYLLQLPWVLFPWTLLAFVGLWITRGQAVEQGRTPERFLWCWALAPIVFLSIPQGKHHHYLLHALVPWAVLAALGTVRLVEYLPRIRWLRTPWPVLLGLGVPIEIALVLVVPRYPTPDGFLPAVLLVWPAGLLACWWILTRRELLRICVPLFALVVVGHWAGYLHPVLIEQRYGDDLAFLDVVRDRVPAGKPVLVLDPRGPLDPSWLLFYLQGRGLLLHNHTFLREEGFSRGEVYLIARGTESAVLREYGRIEEIARSAHSRDELGPDDRYGLYRLRLHDQLARIDAPPYISPMQATGRAPGPVVEVAGNTVAAVARLNPAGRAPSSPLLAIPGPSKEEHWTINGRWRWLVLSAFLIPVILFVRSRRRAKRLAESE